MERLFEKVIALKQYDRTFDPYSLCATLDIEILYFELGDILGFKTTYCDVSLIYLNQQLDAITQRFVVAHELGHILLHKGIRPLLLQYTAHSRFISHFEAEADRFAIILLLCHYYTTTNLEAAPDTLMYELGIPKHCKALFLDTFSQMQLQHQRFAQLLF